MPNTLPFTKMHGLGNDFIVLNNLAQNISLTPEKIRLMADRHYGIGCDQILLLEPAPNDSVDFGYRIFNSDGSQSGQCGNGARCLAKFIHHHKLSAKIKITIATSTSTMQTQLLANDQVKVSMGKPNFRPETLPMLLPQELEYQLTLGEQIITFSALSMGNPHIVIRVEEFNSAEIQTIGNALNNQHPLFPEGVNVGFIQIVDRQHINLRVFERGAGETLACGSGACAAMVAACRRGWVDNEAQITLPGGVLQLQWEPNSSVWMIGPAVLAYEGSWVNS
jgi:diaminopimelate epimerase